MTEPQASPISQLLRTLGITRGDLEKRSDEMRQFLTTLDASCLRVTESNVVQKPPSTDPRPILKPGSATASFTRSRSPANSYTLRDATPPITPVKTEPVEGLPLRHLDSMEMVLERQRLQNKREKRERRERRESQTRANLPRAPSPSPVNASQSGLNLDSFMKTRVETRVPPDDAEDSEASTSLQTSAPPVTPKRSKYYRDHTNLGANTYSQPRQEQTPVKTETQTPTRAQATYSVPPSQTHYVAYHQYLAYSHLLPPLAFPAAQAGPSTLPVTPQHKRTYTLKKQGENSPLPPSSPPTASSPISTPHRPSVNLVSSPGPMGPLPNEEEYDTLPYTLPPGPYSPNKPDLSYAALVGQAILSSPDHRLTLQEIYDWITIVYPHFKRGETTWMNSIRHVLSTTVVFRKVLRERSIGRTQWAIWDEDLECFKGGGFRKHLCKDIINNAVLGSRNKGKSRKRIDADDAADSGRKAKRVKKEHPPPLSAPHLASTSYMPATMSSHPLFPPTRPTTHHQPYYESCMQPQSLPADVIFPPLPAGVGYGRVIPTANSPASESSSSALHREVQPDEGKIADGLDPVEATPHSDTDSAPKSSSSVVPELAPNDSSSSPPPTSSEFGVSSNVDDVCLDDYITISGNDDDSEAPAEEEEETVSSFLSPVKYWGASPKVGKAKEADHSLKQGIKLEFGGALSSSDEDDEPLLFRSSKARKSPDARKLNACLPVFPLHWWDKKLSFPPMPASPTLNRKAHSHLSKVSKPAATGRKSLDAERPTTPPAHPSTPPRSTRQLPISSIRTPLSSKGINPAALHSEGDDDDDNEDLNRTPRKRGLSSGAPIPAPMTPRRLIFPSNQNDSPYRTPGPGTGGNSIFSPFRTPGSRSVFDPHDPAALLDDELNRMGAAAGAGDSPAGLFGKGRGSLLYDSPGLSTSPGQYARWW